MCDEMEPYMPSLGYCLQLVLCRSLVLVEHPHPSEQHVLPVATHVTQHAHTQWGANWQGSSGLVHSRLFLVLAKPG